jgi:hypothetical protein
MYENLRQFNGWKPQLGDARLIRDRRYRTDRCRNQSGTVIRGPSPVPDWDTEMPMAEASTSMPMPSHDVSWKLFLSYLGTIYNGHLDK